MDFYYGRWSGNSSRALFCLEEIGAQANCKLHLLDVHAGDNKAPGYLAIDPMGKIPALVDGEFSLWESNAINWYLAEKFPAANLLPKSPQARADVQRWLFFQAAHITPAAVPVFRATNEGVRRFWKVPPADQRDLDRAIKELQRFLPVLEQRLAERDYLAGEFSLADIAHLPHLWCLEGGGFDFSPYPSLKRWIERTQARPAWSRASAQIFTE